MSSTENRYYYSNELTWIFDVGVEERTDEFIRRSQISLPEADETIVNDE
jgi:hypothetical protein